MKNVITGGTAEVSGRWPPASAITRRLFSFPAFLGVLLLAGTLAGRCLNISTSQPHSGAFSNISFEGDTWWHVVTGNRILSTGHWPSTDPYTFTVHGSPWIAYEWVGEVIMALASRLAGLEGLMGLLLLMSGTYVLLVYCYAYQNCRNPMAAFLACVALLPLASSFFTLRPQMFAYIFLIITLVILEKFRNGHEKALWLLPVLFLIWVNTHSTFVFGFFVVGVYWAAGLGGFSYKFVKGLRWGRVHRMQLEGIFLLCLVASVITPYGSRAAAFPIERLFSPSSNLRTNTEFLPVSLGTLDGKLFVLLLVFFLVYVVVFQPTFRVEELALISVAAYEAFAHIRFMLLFVPIFAPVLAKAFAKLLPDGRREREHPALHAVLIFLVVVLLAKLFPTKRQINNAIANNFPASAVAYVIKHHVAGPMFNNVSWGGYLTWSLTPKHKVFIDSRDIFDYAGVFADYLEILNGTSQTASLLRKYHLRSCLFYRGAGLGSFLADTPGWREVYRDQMSVIYVKLDR